MKGDFLSIALSGAGILAFSASGAMAGNTPVAVPEPSSLALIAGGIAAVAWLKFRRRR